MKCLMATTLLIAALLTACSGGGQPPGDDTDHEVASITVSPETASIEVGQNQTFMAVAKDLRGSPLSNVSFDWHSSDPAVATVANGAATGLAKGTTAITASSNGITSNAATLTVTPGGSGGEPPVITSFTATPPTITTGESSTLSWIVSGATSLSISPDVGTVTGSSVAVQPSVTTEYTLTATNAAGQDSATATVTVSGTEPPPGKGTIAYVSADSWDEIRLIRADGSGDRLLWSHGIDDPGDLADPRGIYNISSLAWRPDGSELAFASTHEMGCSLNTSDIFAVGANGSGYRRITQAPACPELAAYPKGTVRIPLENPYGSQFETIIYFQGAPEAQEVSIPPNGSGIVTFENVADLGNGVMQRAILLNPGIGGDDREFGEETAVDVQQGETVQTPQLTLDYPNISQRLMVSPTWRDDGNALVYAFLYNGPYRIEPQPAPLQQGELLATLYAADHVSYGPAPEYSNQLLYVGEEGLDSGIYLTSEGNAAAGELLVSIDPIYEQVLGLAWLPDGSGFVYSLKAPTPESEFITKANIYLYSFGTEFSKGQKPPLTDFGPNEYAGRLSVSPDAQQLVFERASVWSFLTGELVEPELWVMNRDGSDMRLLVENGRAPAWRR
jgi:hypothetical protein